MLKIGDFSKICRVPVSALRYYADLGLLEPTHTDPFTGYRYYSLDQLPRLNRLLALKDLGLSLDEIARVLKDTLPAEQLRGMLRLKQAEIRHQMSDTQAQLARVEARLRQIEKENTMPTQDVVLKALDPQSILSIREFLPTGAHLGQLLGESCGAIMQQGVEIAAPPFAIFHDKEFKSTHLDVEIAIPVAPAVKSQVALEGGRQLIAHTLPRVEFAASCIHVGDYDALPQTYEALGKWIEANGYQISGPAREIYLREPEAEGGAMTEIQFPVAKA